MDKNISNNYIYKSTSSNSLKVNFKQKLSEDAPKSISNEDFTTASAAATAVGLATISINNNKPTKKLNHEDLAKTIQEKINQGKTYKQISKELGISSSLYCKIVKEYNIQTPRKLTRLNRENINIEDFKQDIWAGKSKTEILSKYNITPAQYVVLLRDYNLKSKKMLNNAHVKTITKEDLLDAIASSHNKAEVYRKLSISDATYTKLKEQFGIVEDPISEHEEWDYMTSSEKNDLAKSNRSLNEICEEYNVSRQRVQKDYRQEGIKTEQVIARENLENADITQIQSDIDTGLSQTQILQKHNISKYQFQILIDKGLISTSQKRARDKINSISVEEFQAVVNSSTNTNMARELLGGISKGAFYNLAKKFEIEIPWVKKKQSIGFPVSKETLETDIKSNLTIEQICKKYSISQHIYYQMIKSYKINYKKSNLNEKTSHISLEQLQERIRSAKFHKDIYAELGLTRKQYSTLLRRKGIITKHQMQIEKIKQISREELVTLILNGATVRDICQKYSITPASCYFLLKQKSVDWSTNVPERKNSKNPNMGIEELKDSVANILINNKQIAENNELSDLIDFVYSLEITDDSAKNNLIKFVKTIKNIDNKNITPEDALKRNEVKIFSDLYEEQLTFIEEYKKAIEECRKINNIEILNILVKYIPNLGANNLAAKTVLDKIQNITNEQELTETLTYYDAKFSQDEYLIDAENYARKDNKINTAEAGKYLLAIRDLKQGSDNEILNRFILEIKHDNITKDNMIKNTIKLKELLQNYDLEDISLTDFSKTFNLNDKDAKSIIKYFIENYYIKNDTTLIAEDDKLRKEEVTLCSKPKQKIYNKYKGTKGIEVLALFDEALHHIVASDGQSGIKFFSRGGIKYPRLKIMGYPDRINSSNFDLIFDEYSDDGGHK